MRESALFGIEHDLVVRFFLMDSFVFAFQNSGSQGEHFVDLTRCAEIPVGRKIVEGLGPVQFRSGLKSFQRCGKTIQRANDEVQRKGSDDQPEPEGMLHFEKMEGTTE